MSCLRIGYVNVRGLMSDKWCASLALLDSESCDLLFVLLTVTSSHQQPKAEMQELQHPRADRAVACT